MIATLWLYESNIQHQQCHTPKKMPPSYKLLMVYVLLSSFQTKEIVQSLVHNLLIRVSDFIKLKKRTRAVVRSSYIRTLIFFFLAASFGFSAC